MSWHARSSSKPPHSMSALQKTIRAEVAAAIPPPTLCSMLSNSFTASPTITAYDSAPSDRERRDVVEEAPSSSCMQLAWPPATAPAPQSEAPV